MIQESFMNKLMIPLLLTSKTTLEFDKESTMMNTHSHTHVYLHTRKNTHTNIKALKSLPLTVFVIKQSYCMYIIHT